MILILQAVLVMLATVVTTLVESTDLPPVPEDPEHMVTLEGSEPLPNREARQYYTTNQLPHHRAASTNPGNWHGQATTTGRYCATTVTRTVNISPTLVPEVPDVPELPGDYCNGPGQFLFKPTNECFLHLSDGLRTFEAADAECRKGGMRLAKPKKPKAIQKHLVEKLGQSGHVWLGARGDGQSFKWQTNDGASIMNTDPLWWTGMPAFYITNDRCLVLVAYPNAVKKEKVFYPEICSSKRTALCQRSQCSPECYLGTCTGPNACVYDPRSAAICPDGCGNGECTGPNECTCSDGYEGDTCDKPNCSETDGFFRGPGNSTQCFKFFKEDRTWTEAEAKCIQVGMVLARPIDPVAMRNYLHSKFGEGQVWIGARGTGATVQWIRDGTTISDDDPLWYFTKYEESAKTTNHCLWLMANKPSIKIHPNKPYRMFRCSHKKGIRTLCELL